MFNADLIERARWGELYAFFVKGDPPLVLILLIINTLFLVVFIIRKSKAKNRMRPSTAYAVQALLIGANMFVMFHGNLIDWNMQNISMPYIPRVLQ